MGMIRFLETEIQYEKTLRAAAERHASDLKTQLEAILNAAEQIIEPPREPVTVERTPSTARGTRSSRGGGGKGSRGGKIQGVRIRDNGLPDRRTKEGRAEYERLQREEAARERVGREQESMPARSSQFSHAKGPNGEQREFSV
jgi:hypothetical protein